MKVESFLPVFNGTYGTLFEDIELTEDCGRFMTAFINKELKDLGIVAEFQSIYSPRFYNFENDSINVEYTFDSLNKLVAYLIDNRDEFAIYVRERYTSAPGFVSHHSNNADEWIQELMFGGELEHKLGSVLEFYLMNEQVTDYDLYEYLCGNGFVYEE